ncbi:MAG TPA: tetratricopeptide repeat protein, partial [Planctomycetaceae bacterium]|nr:tetratricopeptide repeat protein [Planctomycetaceae bacterium]
MVVSALLFWVFWADLCLWRAEVNLAQRNHSAAGAWIARSLWFGHAPDARTALLRLRLARRRQDYADVERELKEATRLGAPLAEVHRERLLAMAQTSQFANLQQSWPELLRDPRDDGPEIARAYYTWCILNHNFQEAQRTLELWHADYPRDTEPLSLLGLYFEDRHELKGAEDAYRRALAIAPRDDKLQLALARVLTTRLDTAAAAPLYREYLAGHPNDVEALRGLAECAAAQGDVPEGLRLLEMAVQASPEDFASLKEYGEMLLASGDAQRAVAPLEKAHRMVPEHAKLANSLARALKTSGRRDEAQPLLDFVAEARPQLERLPELERKLRHDPDDLEARMQIAEITAKYVSRRDAIRWYENLLRIAPRSTAAAAALSKLKQETPGVAKPLRPVDTD